MTDDPTKTGEEQVPNPAAGDETGQEDPNVDPLQVKGEENDPTGQEGNNDEVRKVPLHVIEKMRDEMKQLKDQNALYQAQLQMAQGQQTQGFQGQQQAPGQPPQGTGQTPQPEQTPDPSQVIEGDDDDMVTVGEMRKILANMTPQQRAAADPAILQRMAQLEMQVQDPNWETTIKTYLPEMVNNQPQLANMIKGSPNPMEAALTVARMNPRYQQDSQGQGAGQTPGDDLVSQLNQIIQNSEKPGSPAQGGAGGGFNASNKFETMSEEELDNHVAKVLAGKVS